MNTFLRPFCEKLQECFHRGITWIHPITSEAITSKVVAPLIIADAPARAQVLNITNFNGNFGCNVCEISTIQSKKIIGKKTSRIYPFKVDCTLRSGDRMEEQARQLRHQLDKTDIKGVKGYCMLSCLPLIDIGTCVLPEYMHSVLLGVVKQFIKLWLTKRPMEY